MSAAGVRAEVSPARLPSFCAGAVQVPSVVNNAACNTTGGLSFSWFAREDGSTPLALTAANQATTPNLLFPARSLPVGLTAVIGLTVCYAGTADRRPCGLSPTTAFTVKASPLVTALSGVNAVVGAR